MHRALCAGMVIASSVIVFGLGQGPVVGGQAGGVLPPRDRPATASGTGIVRGRVVDADSGQPLRRATVTLTVTQPPPGERHLLSTTSDGNGQFEFRNVVGGRLDVRASRIGFYHPDDVDGADRPDREPVTLGAGQTVQGVVVALIRGGAIVGRITDEFGEPAAFVEVEVRRQRGQSRERWSGVTNGRPSVSDDTGAFRLWGLQPGTYVVSARPGRNLWGPTPRDEASREGYAPTFYPGTPDAADAAPVVVRSGRDTPGVAFALVPARLAAIRGTLLRPGAGGRQLHLMVSPVTMNRGGSSSYGQMVNDDGSFEVPRLAPGTYRLEAQHWDPVNERAALRGTAEITVSGVDIDGVTIPMRAGATAMGRVVSDDGSAVPGITVRVAPTTRDANLPYVRAVTVGGDGLFTLEGIFGKQRLVVNTTPTATERASARAEQTVSVTTNQGPSPWRLKSVTLGGRDVTDTGIDFDEGDAAVEVTITTRVSRVGGTVTWNRATGAARPWVVVFVDDPDRWEQPSRHVRLTRTGEDSRFQISGLPPGERYLAAAVEDATPQELVSRELLEALRHLASPLRIDDAGTHEIGLQAVANPRP